ncbi:triphosphoribosyl-dephospho-CoA synthase [Halorubrum sp. BV1]|uniref:triphosphoribosyl-dephospho-CoA synthase n=1 Tax=Halorubrum sp. BV1 TaxID=1498500 RepID=UPI0009B5A0CD|nr:triphosphoribosyl-dephospho-CoA synthase [Halorubrum sp. BV1]
MLLEVAGTPKPGNVDRRRDLADLRFESFLGGAVGARGGLELAARGREREAADGDPSGEATSETSVGTAFERAVAGMADRAGTNTQFGCLLLLVPLVRATATGDLSPAGVDRVTRNTTVGDAVAFYRSFERVDIAVAEPPADADALDVRRGGDAETTLRDRGATLRDVMALSTSAGDGPESLPSERVPDRNAQEWTEGFPRTFRAAEWILTDDGPLADRAARAFLGLLATEPDTLVATNRGPDVARDATARAAAVVRGNHKVSVLDGPGDRESGPLTDPPTPDAVHAVDLATAETLADAFVDEGINPGTTADLTCAALYVALRRGAEVAP